MEEKLDIQTRPYQKGDEKHLSAILEKIYHRKFNAEYWRWKYLDNPLGTHFCHCALIEGRIIGFAGGIPYRIKWKDREIIAAQITDLAVEPDLQGKKAFSPVQDANIADMRNRTDAFYGFTNKNSYRVYSKKDKNFDYAFHVPRMIKILNATAFLKQRIPSTIIAKAGGAVANAALLAGERLRKKRVKSEISIRAVESIDSAVDSFLKETGASFKVMHIRDHQYLNWRYARHPVHRHAMFVAEEENRTVGLMVLRDEPDIIHRGTILEFFASPEREDVQHLLLHQAVDHFRRCGADIVICWVFPHSPYYKTFKRHLFGSRPGDLIVLTSTTRKNDELKNDLKNPLNWHVSCGDHEAF
jgi:GNAT superfamily N-acetyltransferase